MLLFIGGSEIFLIAIVFLLLFGAKSIPDLMKGLGKGVAEFKKATDSIKKEIEDTDIVKDIKEAKDNLDQLKPKL
ncbi:MAG TPA: twin-arginine translocase TatA/TatE family subunit [Bacteroidales bacterium]|nr:twin-arginine translocase TatA/TatE family subunit [Bacteroidales bacterium]